MKAKVWDPANEDEEGARSIELDEHPDFIPGECEAIELAERYAENDTDGEIDGIYSGGHDIIVLFEMEPPKRYTVNVTVDYEPSYSGNVKQL